MFCPMDSLSQPYNDDKISHVVFTDFPKDYLKTILFELKSYAMITRLIFPKHCFLNMRSSVVSCYLNLWGRTKSLGDP